MGDIERAARSQQQRANELKKLVNLRVSEISAEELLAAQRLFEEVLTGYAEIIQKIERIETVRESIVRFRDDLNIDDEVINVSARALTNIDTLPQHELVRIRDELVNSQAFLRSSNVVNFVSRTIEYLETTRDPEAREQCDRHADLNRRASESLNQIETRLRSFGPPPPPPPPPAAPAAKRIMAKAVANPPHYFFAYTLEEFINKGTELQATNNNNLKDYELAAERALTASKALNISASTQQQRISIQHNIDTQLNKLRDLIGFLEDCERRAKGVNRDRAGRPREDDLINAPMKMSKEVIAERLLRLHECEATLLEAKAKIQPILASGATKNVYYTNLDYHNVCATEAEALQKATEYLRNNGSAGINENHTVAAGHRNIGDNTTELYSYRFTPTEITTSTGTLPVALIQQTNQSQTYSKQTVLTPKGTLEALKKMTHDEQVEFVRDMIETQLASITTNGPIRLSRNWDPALAKAAALHCKAMGYDLQPSEWLKKVKDKDATNYFTSNVNQPFMQQAIARRDMKLHAKSAPRSAARTPSSPAPLPVSPKLPPVAPLKAAGAKAPLAAKDPKVAEPDPIRPPHPGRGHHK